MAGEGSGGGARTGPAGPRGKRRLVLLVIALATAGALLLGVAGIALYVRGGGPLPSWAGFLRPADRSILDPSPPAEVVLRTLRLAGYEHAVVGDSEGTVVARVEVPVIDVPDDVALTWQTAMAACSTAYPSARRVVVQVFSGREALVEVSASGADVTAAVAADDAAALKRACTFRYLWEAGGD